MTDTDILYMAAQEKRITELENENRELKRLLKAKELKESRETLSDFKLGNMKEALALIRTLKAELNGWRENPFDIIAEVCGAATDCRRCQWYEKCPFRNNYGSYPKDWRVE